jgi:hypothetical protein
MGRSGFLLHDSEFWGPSYFENNDCKNFFIAELEDKSRYALPSMEQFNRMLVTDIKSSTGSLNDDQMKFLLK